jgi:BMFP domain-containing protein YqiC
MKIAQAVLLLFSLGASAAAQSPTPVPAPPATPPGSVSMTAILPQLDRLQSAASQANSDLGYMRIEKWKADANSKQQAQSNADSIQRNLTQALPALISAVRGAPQDVNAEFKLYRNLNVLYDVFASLTESAGAFGPRSDYDALAQQLAVIDSVRRSLGDSLENLTAATQSEINQLRTQVQTLQQKAAATPPAPPKKVIVDDTEPAKKTTAHKKKPAQSTTQSSGSSSSTSTSGSSTNPSPPKQQ